jgi:dimethylamine/trimethylamine dehydrogenase
MSEYIRVRDYREQQLAAMSNVEIYRESALTVDDVLAVGASHVAIATGAHWRADRFDGAAYVSVAAAEAAARVLTADDVMDGTLPAGPTLVYDEDGYYLGGVIAERLRRTGIEVTLCTPRDNISDWAGNTGERWRIRSHLAGLGVGMIVSHGLERFDGETAKLVCEYSGAVRNVPAVSVVMVTQRRPNDSLYRAILATVDGDSSRLPFALQRIGDCDAPAIVAAAVYAGHRYARELDAPADVDRPLRHDRVDVGLAV